MATFQLAVHWIARVGLGGFFLLAGGVKALDPGSFQAEVLAYQIVGHGVSWLVAHYLPVFEIMLGLGILLGIRLRFAAGLSIALLVGFIAALAWTWGQGIDLSCGCLGAIDFIEGQPAAIARDLVLIGFALGLYGWPKRSGRGEKL